MFAAQRTMTEVEHLEPAQRRAALQAAYGAVSARPVFYVAMAAMACCVTLAIVAAESIRPDWPGRVAGAAMGALIGGALHDQIMRRAMRPHIMRFLAGIDGHR